MLDIIVVLLTIIIAMLGFVANRLFIKLDAIDIECSERYMDHERRLMKIELKE